VHNPTLANPVFGLQEDVNLLKDNDMSSSIYYRDVEGLIEEDKTPQMNSEDLPDEVRILHLVDLDSLMLPPCIRTGS
jgi:hypothetical protein